MEQSLHRIKTHAQAIRCTIECDRLDQLDKSEIHQRAELIEREAARLAAQIETQGEPRK